MDSAVLNVCWDHCTRTHGDSRYHPRTSARCDFEYERASRSLGHVFGSASPPPKTLRTPRLGSPFRKHSWPALSSLNLRAGISPAPLPTHALGTLHGAGGTTRWLVEKATWCRDRATKPGR
jgi:hypothetical protein